MGDPPATTPPAGRGEALLRRLLDQHADYIAVLGADGIVTWANATLTRVFGWRLDEAVGHSVFEHIHPDDAGALVAAMGSGVEPGGRWAASYRMRCRDGSWRLVESSGANLIADHEVGGLVVSTRDVTGRRRDEEILAEQRDHLDRQLRFAGTLHRMSESIANVDEQRDMLDILVRDIGETLGLDRCLLFDCDRGRDLAVGMCEWLNRGNPEATSILRDYPLESFRDSWRQMWSTHAPIESHADAVALPLATEGSGPYVHGELRIRSLLWYPFCLRADGFFMIAINQVGRRREWRRDEITFIESAAAQVNLALQKQRMLAERARAEDQLRQSQKMEAIGRLAGGIAHDFNNLLTAIIGYADLMKDKLATDHPLRRHVEGILQVANRASSTTHQLLSFSRRQVIRTRTLKLNALVAQLESLLRRLIGENIELVVRLAPDAGRVRVDPGQLELALVNLAVNARDAMPGGGTLAMSTSTCRLDADAASRLHLAAGTYACIVVADSGVGMDDETRRHLFEPFFTTKDLGKGTGLGLSSVYGIVNVAGGGIQVDSALGRGSTFTVYLPLDEATESTPTHAAEISGAGGGTETILMVEDDDTLRSLLGETLSARGYRVLSAHDGDEALRLAAGAGHMDLVLSDVVMPRMDGPSLVRALLPRFPGIRILFMSGYTADAFADDPDLARYPVITKPFNIDDLARAVREAIDAGKREG
jgi:PAS domain S-box-containing protein